MKNNGIMFPPHPELLIGRKLKTYVAFVTSYLHGKLESKME